MNAPLIHFGNGYTVQRNRPHPRGVPMIFTLNGTHRATGLEFNDIVAALVDQGVAQAEHIASLEAALDKAQSSTPRMDVLMVRCKEWMMREHGEAVTDVEVSSMFAHCLQGHFIPAEHSVIAGLEQVREFKDGQAAEQAAAQADAVSVGMGFIVHGVRVSPDDVTVLGGCKVVDDLRQAKKEALAALQAVDIDKTKWRDHSMILNGALWRMALTMGEAPEESDELFIDPQELIDRYFARETGWTSNGHVSPECHANAIECMNKRASAMEWINDFLGFGQGPDTSVDAACEWTLAGVRRVNKLLNEREVECATVGPRLAQLCELVGLTPPSSKPADLYDMAFAILGLVNGKLRRGQHTVWGVPVESVHKEQPVDPAAHLTDPTKPITLDAPGVSKSCGVCGAIFEGEGMFCALHANADLLGL